MLFYMPSLRCAVVMGLGLLYSLANAKTFDAFCKNWADQHTIFVHHRELTGSCFEMTLSGTTYRDHLNYMRSCMCGNSRWFGYYSTCLHNQAGKHLDWITSDEKKRCSDCQSEPKLLALHLIGMKTKIASTVVPRLVITFIHQASHHQNPSFITASSSSLRQSPSSGTLRQVPSLPRSQAREVP
ncbi:BQ5605_C030g10848 [Microbotryum silenes-dioicae]|uniref:BQ5605_C030g10848 protein n=1 Tax=Microbotryum silenes-dioicae TaxID=796604 RepID=A0A2X0MKU2_9BASI|nr:BQ5605_C030g10848 [Microbotryum silenes-dioicae]